MILEKDTTLLLIGDSLTDCERSRPLGDSLRPDSLGYGYVNLLAALFGAICPEMNIRLLNTGVAGNTVANLFGRWQRDVLDHGPDWVSLMIGINDAAHTMYGADGDVEAALRRFTETLEQLIDITIPQVKGMILVTPFLIEPNRDEFLRWTMDQFGAAVKDLATANGTVFVDTQAAFDAVLEHVEPTSLAFDRVHVNLAGHMIIARAFAKAIGLPW